MSPVWHPFTQHGLQEPIPLVERAEGAALHLADGRRVVDAISSWWVTTHGHAHPRIMAAIRDQSEKLDQLIFAGWTHEPAESLAAELIRITPDPLTRVFFSDSGSTSVVESLQAEPTVMAATAAATAAYLMPNLFSPMAIEDFPAGWHRWGLFKGKPGMVAGSDGGAIYGPSTLPASGCRRAAGQASRGGEWGRWR